MPLKTGTRVGPYIVIESLKVGASGSTEVYGARLDNAQAQECALKLSYAFQTDLRWRADVLSNEVVNLQGLRHPYIVKILPIPWNEMPHTYMAQAKELPGEPWYWALEYLAGGFAAPPGARRADARASAAHRAPDGRGTRLPARQGHCAFRPQAAAYPVS